tara:strand:- start:141 stop:536 length:396 start_codon:yes stop_codon:yes gene_type:complete
MSTLAVGTIKSVSSAAPVFQNTSGTEKGQLATCWINFTGINTIAIKDSFNVSSITDNGVGNYQVTFANSMANDDYAVSVTGSVSPHANGTHGTPYSSVLSTSSFTMRFFNAQASGSVTDKNDVSCIVLGGS